MTGGGVTAGIDVALALPADLAGGRTAAAIRPALDYHPLPRQAATPTSPIRQWFGALRGAVCDEQAGRITVALVKRGRLDLNNQSG